MRTLESLKVGSQLPSPKGVALAILEVCRREDTTTTEIARIVQTDPALSGRLLHLSNSIAMSSGGRQTASVPEAILRVGLAAVRQLALGFSLVDQSQNGPCKAFDYPRFWSHSLLMALAMQRLARISRAGAADELFACGLLARVGCLGLATIYPDEYASILEQSSSDTQLVELERQRLQIDHNELTAAMLTDWGIPKSLVEPVSFHEAPAASGFIEGSRPYQLANLFYLAKRVADLGVATEDARSDQIPELMRLGSQLGLDTEAFGAVIDELGKEWIEWGALLKVPAAALPAFSVMAAPPSADLEESPAALRVLLVEDDPTTLMMMESLLGELLGHTVFTATQGKEALALAVEVMPQVVLTDWMMPVMDGIELCRALRATEWGQSMYVIMLTGVDAEDDILKAFEVGVDDYVTKPINVRALRARLRAAWHYVQLLESWERDRAQLKQFTAELAISNRRLEHVALTDQLTNLPNRRAGMTALDQAWRSAERTGQALAVLAIDVDHFKKVNDSYGHAVGDLVLKAVAKAIQDSARKDDSICRMGGEEFLFVCRNTDLRAALQAAERLRKMIAGLVITVSGAEVRTSISIGIACKGTDTPDADALVNTADKALYGAKHGGRNRTCLMTQGQLLFSQVDSSPQ